MSGWRPRSRRSRGTAWLPGAGGVGSCASGMDACMCGWKWVSSHKARVCVIRVHVCVCERVVVHTGRGQWEICADLSQPSGATEYEKGLLPAFQPKEPWLAAPCSVPGGGVHLALDQRFVD